MYADDLKERCHVCRVRYERKKRVCGVLFVGISRSEDGCLLVDSSGVVVVVSNGVETLPALILSALVYGCEGV